jgi:hypothetical protein
MPLTTEEKIAAVNATALDGGGAWGHRDAEGVIHS